MQEEAKALAAQLSELIAQAEATTALVSKARANTKFSEEVVEKVISGYRPKLEPLVDPLQQKLNETTELGRTIEETYRLGAQQKADLEEILEAIELRKEIGELTEEEAATEAAESSEKLANSENPPGLPEVTEALEACREVLGVMDSVLGSGLEALSHLEPLPPPAEPPPPEPVAEAPDPTPPSTPTPDVVPAIVPPPAPGSAPAGDSGAMEFDVDLDLGLDEGAAEAAPNATVPAQAITDLDAEQLEPVMEIDPEPVAPAAPDIMPPPAPTSSGSGAMPPPIMPPPAPVAEAGGAEASGDEEEAASTMAMPSLSALLDQLGAGGLGALGQPAPGSAGGDAGGGEGAEPPVHATAEFDSITGNLGEVQNTEAGPLPARVILMQKDGSEEIYPFVGDVLSIGRGRNNDIQIRNDAKISRYHCRIYRNGSQYVIEDNRSSNGTIVNGDPIDSAALAGGESIIIGETPVIFQLG